jgi:hypothetical protein
VLEIESKKNGSVELKFATRRELYAWWKRLQRIQERTMKLGLPADPRAQKFLPRHCRSTERTGSLDAVADSVSDAAETAAAHNDPDSWVVVQHCAKRILERLTRPPRVDTANLGPRVFAYRVRDAIGQLGEILTYVRDDIMLETQREGRKVSVSCWRHVEQWHPGTGTRHMGEHDVVVYCSSTRSSGRSDAISSGALTICCELRCALVAVDFLGSGGSQDAGASFGYWERYDLLAAVRYAKRQFPSAKIVLWGGAPTGAVACALYGSVRLEVALKGMILDGCTTQLKTHVSDLASLAIKPTSALRRKLVDDVVALVDERFRKRTGVGLKAVAPQTAITNHAFSGTHCLLIGEKDGDVGTARDADILHSELDRAHPEDEHHLLLVGGRTARQRHKKRHVPQALEAVAAFIGRRFDVSKGFRYFTVNSPKGIRDHLLHSVPPWDHSDADDADLRATHEALTREESILPSEPSFRAPLLPSESNEEYKEYHGGDDPGPGRTRIVKAISFHE